MVTRLIGFIWFVNIKISQNKNWMKNILMIKRLRCHAALSSIVLGVGRCYTKCSNKYIHCCYQENANHRKIIDFIRTANLLFILYIVSAVQYQSNANGDLISVLLNKKIENKRENRVNWGRIAKVGKLNLQALKIIWNCIGQKR